MADYDCAELINEEFWKNVASIDCIVLHVVCDKGFITVRRIVSPIHASLHKYAKMKIIKFPTKYLLLHDLTFTIFGLNVGKGHV